MIICPECSGSIAEGSRFCPHCGLNLITECPHCGTHTDGGKYCRECGAKLYYTDSVSDCDNRVTLSTEYLDEKETNKEDDRADLIERHEMQIPADRCDHSANIGVSVPV